MGQSCLSYQLFLSFGCGIGEAHEGRPIGVDGGGCVCCVEVSLEGAEPVAVVATGGEHLGVGGGGDGRGGLAPEVGVLGIEGVGDGQVKSPEKPGCLRGLVG